MRAVILPLVAATLALSGCTALDDLDRRLSAALNPQEPAPAPVVEPFQPLPERKPTDVPPPKRQPAKRAPAAPATLAPEPEPVPPEPEEPADTAEAAAVAAAPKRGKLPEGLVGLSAEQLRARFGTPAEEIEETPGVTWRYRPEGCVLDIHLFPRVESQGLYALDASAETLTVEECLAVLTAPPEAEPAAAAETVDEAEPDASERPDAAAEQAPAPADTAATETAPAD
ncbi:hypothetical protein C882_1082 [Caenispirillum salinarum AK4]|uniref:Uncharacterized protein n=1 Tax=Caenispirillum salinarum AK4 TaxID=1238182 RepID=K9HHI6_9PROT|nr:hypothetical protein [Caenispirillum salinarum]EKV28081.1 hypothetical protein C882_1082 [Caenispirillum salinarum AK4]